ncbi:hypothetical protein BH24PSE2_BH24PSE2_24510 [soil metagenome]
MSVYPFPQFHHRSVSRDSACEILVLSGDPGLIANLEAALEGAHRVHHARRIALATDVLNERDIGVLIADAGEELPPYPALVRRFRREFPDLVIIGVGDPEAAVPLIEAANDGLIDRILLKPLPADEVRRQVQSAIRQHIAARGDGAAASEAFGESLDCNEDMTEPQSEDLLRESSPVPVPVDSPAPKSLPAVWKEPAPPAPRSVPQQTHWWTKRTAVWAAGGIALAAALVGLAVWLPEGDGGIHRPAPAAGIADAASNEVQRALDAARLALKEGHYVSPANDNALDHYLAVLEIEPDHPRANIGLDTIAGVLLDQAQTALERHDVADALALRRLARDIRPEHPILGFVDAGFRDHGEWLIARADLAGADDLDGESRQLDLAARLLPRGSTALAAARDRLAERRADTEIEKRLALVSERIEADSLTVPEHDSARFHLLELQSKYPYDERVVAERDRLADIMLQLADNAIGEAEWQAARRWLRLTEGLGVQSDALVAKRSVLETAEQRAADNKLRSEERAFMERALEEEAATLAKATARAEEMGPKLSDLEPVEPVQVRSSATFVLEGRDRAGAAPVQMSELEMLRMVEPAYPRRAYVRDIAGWVDVEFTVTEAGATRDVEVTGAEPQGWFDRAAIGAVEQWQFRPEIRDGQPVERRTKARLQFTRETPIPESIRSSLR